MKRLFAILFLMILFTELCFSQQNHKIASEDDRITKKGIGLAERSGLGAEQLNLLRVGWYYNWSTASKLNSKVEFVPMVFSLKSIDVTEKNKIILAFNEPDNSRQSDVSVADALKNWPLLLAKSNTISSPAMAGNPIKEGGWLADFMRQNPRVDFIAVHWYKGCDSQKFIADINGIIKKYHRPVWITEFAPQTASSSRDKPEKYSQPEVTKFLKDSISWMEREPMVQRYAWHDSKSGTSSIFTQKGELTQTGKDYRDSN